MAHWNFAPDDHQTTSERLRMASTAPRLPEQFRLRDEERFASDFTVSELASDAAGAHSPFGDTVLPMPLSELAYVHPGPEDLPHVLRVPGND